MTSENRDYTRLCLFQQIIRDYFRLFPIISDYSITKTKTIIRDHPKRRLFHLLHYNYFTFFPAYIIAIITIMHDYVH